VFLLEICSILCSVFSQLRVHTCIKGNVWNESVLSNFSVCDKLISHYQAIPTLTHPCLELPFSRPTVTQCRVQFCILTLARIANVIQVIAVL